MLIALRLNADCHECMIFSGSLQVCEGAGGMMKRAVLDGALHAAIVNIDVSSATAHCAG